MSFLKNSIIILGLSFVTTGAFASFNDLPLNDAIKTVRGDGSRKIAVFSDPTCPYSQSFEASLAKVNNITVYTFVTPIRGGESVTLSRDIICSYDASSAWKDWMLNQSAPRRNSCNTISLTRNLPLFKKIGGRGTPYSLLVNGSVIPGAAGVEDIERMLSFAHRGSARNVQQPQQSQQPQGNAYSEGSSAGSTGGSAGMFR